MKTKKLHKFKKVQDSVLFARIEQQLHNQIDEIQRLGFKLSGENKKKCERVFKQLNKAHWLIHELDYTKID